MISFINEFILDEVQKIKMRTYYIYGGTEKKRDDYVINRIGVDEEGYLDCDLIKFEDSRWYGISCGSVCWIREFDSRTVPYREFFHIVDNHMRCFETHTGFILNNYSTVFITSETPAEDLYLGMKKKYRSIILKKLNVKKLID